MSPVPSSGPLGLADLATSWRAEQGPESLPQFDSLDIWSPSSAPRSEPPGGGAPGLTPVHDVQVAIVDHVSTQPGMGKPVSAAEPRDPVPSQVRRLLDPSIPRAPAIPKITPPPDVTPSYAPRRRTSTDSLPEVGPADAAMGTRYSESPQRAEYVWSRQPSDHPPKRPSQPPRARPSQPPGVVRGDRLAPHGAARSPSQPPKTARPSDPPQPKIRSDFPRSPSGQHQFRPSLFEVATMLDDGHFEAALEALRRVEGEREADFRLMRARALAGANRSAEALSELHGLCALPALESEVRASAARVMIELGTPEQALEHARRAMVDASDQALVRLTLAWAAVRTLHRSGDERLAREAEAALDGLRARGGLHPGLVQSLRACIQAHAGDAERSIGVAQRALGLDSKSVDALAAVTIASARLRRVHDAQQAWLRLHEVNPTEAAAVAPMLGRNGIELPDPSPQASNRFGGEEDARSLWDELELALLAGERRRVQLTFENHCRSRLAELATRGEDEGFPAISSLAVRVLTTHPVFCHFAPFDLSLWSISRVKAALDVLYDPAHRLDDEVDDFPVVLLVGAYLGQVLCQAHAAQWDGALTELHAAQVVGVDRTWSPFEVVGQRLRSGKPIDFGIADDLKLAHPGADPWATHVAPSVAPPAPWGVTVWPRVALLPHLGRAVSWSIIADWCSKYASGPLDGSVSSLSSLDAFLILIAPPVARPDEQAPWVPRVAVLLGAYFGEVLRETIGGAWERSTGDVRGPLEYRLRLGRQEFLPVAEVYARIVGRSKTPLLEVATRLAR